MERITSSHNPLVQHMRKLQTSRAYRESCGEFVADGWKLLEEALKWYPEVTAVLTSEPERCPALPSSARLVEVPASLMQSVSSMRTPQGVLFSLRLPQEGALRVQPGMLLLDRIQEEEKAATGKTAAYFRLPNAEGKQITRSNFKDQYLLIHFWASWDTVSRDSNAVYRRIYRKGQKNKKFALLGISLDLNKDNWKKAIETDTLKWEQACDLSGWETGVVKQLAIRTLPANVLLSPSGRIEGKNLSETAIEKKLKDIEEQEKKEKKREIENERKKKR
jgi:peroxiredoxin